MTENRGAKISLNGFHLAHGAELFEDEADLPEPVAAASPLDTFMAGKGSGTKDAQSRKT
jgi:hypothetical protein